MPRPIIDGRTTGFCKLIVDRQLHTILGCHIVGERAVELAQLAAIATAAEMKVEQLALVPFSFPTYANAMARAAIKAARELDLPTTSTEEQFPPEAGLPSTSVSSSGASATCFRASGSALVIGRLSRIGQGARGAPHRKGLSKFAMCLVSCVSR